MKGLTFRIFSFELHRTTICVFERLFGFATNQGKARQKDNTRAGIKLLFQDPIVQRMEHFGACVE